MMPRYTATDVALVTSPYPVRHEQATREIKYFDQCCQLGEGLWLGPVDPDLTEAVLAACERRGENFSPVRQFGAPYGLVRGRAPSPEGLQFDPDNLLTAAVALSRLVHPTSIGLSYAARIRHRDGQEREIIPGAPENLNPNAFVADEMANWLVPGDADGIAELLRAYQRQDAPKRVQSALWNHEIMFRNYFVETRWGMAVTGLESLFHVRGELDPGGRRHAGSRRVFVQRSAKAAEMLGASGVTEDRLVKSYDRRSDVVHGAGIDGLDAGHRDLYLMTERLLSLCIRSALLDPTFSSHFDSDDEVKAAFPLH